MVVEPRAPSVASTSKPWPSSSTIRATYPSRDSRITLCARPPQCVWRRWSAPPRRSSRGSSPPRTGPRLEAAAVEIGLVHGPLRPLVQAVLERPGQADDSPATRLPAQVEFIDAEAAAAGRAVVWWRTPSDRVVRVPGRDLEPRPRRFPLKITVPTAGWQAILLHLYWSIIAIIDATRSCGRHFCWWAEIGGPPPPQRSWRCRSRIRPVIPHPRLLIKRFKQARIGSWCRRRSRASGIAPTALGRHGPRSLRPCSGPGPTRRRSPTAVGGPEPPVPGQPGADMPHRRQPHLQAVRLLLAGAGGLSAGADTARRPAVSRRRGREPPRVRFGAGQLETAAVDGEDHAAADEEPFLKVLARAVPEGGDQHQGQRHGPGLEPLGSCRASGGGTSL